MTTLITLLRGCLLPHEDEKAAKSPLRTRTTRDVPVLRHVVARGMLQASTGRSSQEDAELSGAAPTMDAPETFFEYFVDDTSKEWAHWESRVPSGRRHEEEKPKFAAHHPLDSVRLERCWAWSPVDEAALFVGGPGTAKTTAIKQFMAGFDMTRSGRRRSRSRP